MDMITSSAIANIAPRWKAYASAVVFLAPALLAWWFSTMFLFPKLQQIWADTGFTESAFMTIMRCANSLLANAGWILAAVVLIFGMLEWRGGAWSRYRGISVSIGAWFLNAAVVLLLTAMLLSALMAAPGLVTRQ